jgi:hypothetical protein
MANVMTAEAKTVTREEEERGCCCYLGLEDYFERLDEGKDAYREFQEHQPGTRDEYYYALIASLLA